MVFAEKNDTFKAEMQLGLRGTCTQGCREQPGPWVLLPQALGDTLLASAHRIHV